MSTDDEENNSIIAKYKLEIGMCALMCLYVEQANIYLHLKKWP